MDLDRVPIVAARKLAPGQSNLPSPYAAHIRGESGAVARALREQTPIMRAHGIGLRVTGSANDS